MGLDMYLKKRIFIGGEYEHRKVSGTVKLKICNKRIILKPTEISEIISRVGHWYKANAIHKWFVDNVQDGVDECQESHVSFDQLEELKRLCEQVLATKNPLLLPPQAGFFFGSLEIDEYYWKNLEETIAIISKLEPDKEYFYQSSW